MIGDLEAVIQTHFSNKDSRWTVSNTLFSSRKAILFTFWVEFGMAVERISRSGYMISIVFDYGMACLKLSNVTKA